MIISGKNGVIENLRAGKTFNKILISKSVFGFSDIVSLAKEKGIKVEFLDRSILDKKAKNNQGIVAEIVDFVYSDLQTILNDERGLVVILDGIEDPHNFGAIIRSCECAGVSGIIIPKHRAVPVNDTVIKTSAGAVANVNICMVTNINNAIKELQENGFWVYGAEADGKVMYDCKLQGKTAFVIGSEGFGISKLTRQNCDEVVSIPLCGKVNSLNASVACSIVLFEYIRQNFKK